jgi:hypothetical protein
VLFYGIVELAEGVAELEAAGEELEALDVIGVVGLLLGERRDDGWVVVDDCGLDEVWLDKYPRKGDRVTLPRGSPFRTGGNEVLVEPTLKRPSQIAFVLGE